MSMKESSVSCGASTPKSESGVSEIRITDKCHLVCFQKDGGVFATVIDEDFNVVEFSSQHLTTKETFKFFDCRSLDLFSEGFRKLFGVMFILQEQPPEAILKHFNLTQIRDRVQIYRASAGY